MAEVITKTYREESQIINQCDIFKDVEFIEYVKEENLTIEVSKIIFPLVVILTQSCDLMQDFTVREKNRTVQASNQDKFLISVIAAPVYNFEDFRLGQHLEQVGLKMTPVGARTKTPCKNIIQNENKRFHYLKFGDEIPIAESIIDFKHYFTVNSNYLSSIYQENYVCSIDSLYRELISQRFSNFLSRIGLPDPIG